MEGKTLQVRVALLYKTYEEWSKADYVPLKGEICFCEIPENAGIVVSEPCVLYKVGDGIKSFAQLPWNSALAADIFAWAKKENLEFIDLTEEFKDKLVEYLEPRLLHKDTLYKIISIDENKWQLQKSEDHGETWINAEGTIDISTIVANLSSLIDSKVTEETTRAKEIENIIQANLEAEVEARELADEALQTEIDSIHIAEYEIEKLEDPGEFAARYILTKDGIQAGVTIDIAKDQVLKNVEIKTAGKDDPSGFPEGTKYIDFEWSTGKHSYVNLQDLVDIYIAGTGIDINDKNVISIKPEVLDRIANLETEVVNLREALEEEITRAILIEATKVDKEIITESGISSVINSATITGLKWSDNNEAVSFIGIDNTISEKYVVLYNHSTDKNIQIGLTKDGAYYTINKAIFEAEDELVTKKDIKSISGAMHYRGVFPSLDVVPNPQAGDVVVVNLVEYIYNGTKWDSIGEEGLWATKVALETEIGRAKEAEYALTQSILSEMQSRETADTELAQNITAEAQIRETEDTNLQAQIDNRTKESLVNNYGSFNLIRNAEDAIDISLSKSSDSGAGILGQYNAFYYWNGSKLDITAKDELATIGDISEYSLVKDDKDIYHLTKDGEYIGAEINVAKTLILKEATVKVCVEKDIPVSGLNPGDKYIDFEWANGNHSYIAAKDLFVAYKAGDGINIADDNTISINIAYIEEKTKPIVLDAADYGFNTSLKDTQEVAASDLVDAVLNNHLNNTIIIKWADAYLTVIDAYYNLDLNTKGFICNGAFLSEYAITPIVNSEVYVFNYIPESSLTLFAYLDSTKKFNDFLLQYSADLADVYTKLSSKTPLDWFQDLRKTVVNQGKAIHQLSFYQSAVNNSNNLIILKDNFNLSISENLKETVFYIEGQNDLRIYIPEDYYANVGHTTGKDELFGTIEVVTLNDSVTRYRAVDPATKVLSDFLPVKKQSIKDTTYSYAIVRVKVADWDINLNKWIPVSSLVSDNYYNTNIIVYWYKDDDDYLVGAYSRQISYSDWEHLYNHIDWYATENKKTEVDNLSIDYLEDNLLEIKGYHTANTGQVPSKGEDNSIEWVTPVAQEDIDSLCDVVGELVNGHLENVQSIDKLNQSVQAEIVLGDILEDIEGIKVNTSQNDFRIYIHPDYKFNQEHEEGQDVLYGSLKVYPLDCIPEAKKIGNYDKYAEDFISKPASAFTEDEIDENNKKFAKFNIPVAEWSSDLNKWIAISKQCNDYYYPSYGLLVEWYDASGDAGHILGNFSKRISYSDWDHFYNNKDWYSVEPAYTKADDESIIHTGSGKLTLFGFRSAAQGQVPAFHQDPDGGRRLAWIDPVTTSQLDEKVKAASVSAQEAGRQAVTATNAAIEAHQYEKGAWEAVETIRSYIWRGTLEEYNALEQIDPEVIYIIVS